MPDETTALVERNEKGQLQPGSKLGKGRKKGSKNKATLLREKMENKVSIKLSKAVPAIVDTVIDQSMEGCRQSQKMILDRAVPVKRADDGSTGRDTAVHITISDLTRDNVHDEHDITSECEVVED
jgi:hypothetical protein